MGKKDLYVLIIFVMLTLLMTRPLIFFLRTHTPGFGDNMTYMWFFWWFKYSLIDLKTNPYFTDYIFYPVGSYLGSFDTMPYNSFLAIPLQILFGIPFTYNILLLSTFVISAFGIYCLSFHLTKNKIASFIAGIYFAFSPQRFGIAFGSLNLLSIQWLPFYILYLIKFVKDQNKKNIILLSIFFVLTSLSSWYYFTFAILFTVIFLVYQVWVERNKIFNIRFFKSFILFILASLLVLSPFLYPLLSMQENLKGEYIANTDLVSYFVPSNIHFIFRPIAEEIRKNIADGLDPTLNVFFGYTALVLLVYTFLKCREKGIKFWKLSFMFFFLFSLGTNLVIFKQSEFTSWKIKIPLPFFFLDYLPKIVKVLPVVGPMVTLSISILLVFGIKKILSHLSKRKGYLFSICIISLFLFESFTVPFDTTIPVPEFYNMISKDKEDYTILELPVGVYPSSHYYGSITYSCYQYYQTIHQKKLIGGYLARKISEEAIDSVEKTPFINNLRHTGCLPYQNCTPPSIPNEMLKNASIPISVLKRLNVRYVILHKKFLFIREGKLADPGIDKYYPVQEYAQKTKLILDSIFNKSYYEDNHIVVYRVEQ